MKKVDGAAYVLQKIYHSRKANNPSYSYRSYAKSIGMAPSCLSEILSGKRKLTERMLRSLKANLDENEFSGISALPELVGKKQEIYKASLRRQLPEQDYHIVREPVFYSILCLLETAPKDTSAEYFASKLSLPVDKVREAIDLLLKRKYVQLSNSGRLKLVPINLVTTRDVTNDEITIRHKQNLKDAAVALDEVPILERDFSFTTMAIDKKKLPEAKEKILAFRREMMEFLEAGVQTDVYELCVQLFPRTNDND